MEVIVFPDAEGIVVAALETALSDHGRTAPVSVTVPQVRPAEFVTVQRSGGPARDIVTDAPQLTFDCWAATGAAALSLAQLVRGIVRSWRGTVVGGMTVYRVQEFAGPSLLPDPVSKQPRYRFTATVEVRGTASEGGTS